MDFAYPKQIFWVLPFAVLFALVLRRYFKQKTELTRLIEKDVIEKVFPFSLWQKYSLFQIILQFAGILFLIVALVGPRLGQKLKEVETSGSSVFILLDTSDSMLAEDFKPNRMEKSKMLLTALVERMRGSRVGIIAFAGEAYVFCPITFDFTTVKQFLKSIEPGMIPQPGTRIGSAIRLALSKMPEEKKSKAIILLTDGEDHSSDPLGAAREAHKSGVKIFAIGIGSPQGEPIPIRDSSGKTSGYRKDQKGEVILSHLGESELLEMSLLTGGAYFRASPAEKEVDVLLEKLEELEKDPLQRKQKTYENRYRWFLLPAFLFLILSEALIFFYNRLGVRTLRQFIFLVFLLGHFIFAGASHSGAESFSGKMEEGNELYREKKYSQALEKFEEAEKLKPEDTRGTFNKGASLYKLERWEEARDEFQKGALSEKRKLRAKSLYNLGNSQFKNGEYAEAVNSYKQSLALNPNDPDARFNLQLALKFKKNPPPQQKKSKQDKKKEKDSQREKRLREEEKKEERRENAKRTLKGALDEQNNKPIFNPDQKDKGKKNERNEKDW